MINKLKIFCKKHRVFCIFLLFYLIGLTYKIWANQPFFSDWDEGMYAQIASEILKNKSLFTTFNGHIWLDKPPLVHFLIAIVFFVFGQSEFWSRMLSVVASVILLILVYILSLKINKALFKKTGDKKLIVASMLPILVLSVSPIFLERAIILNSDIFVAIAWAGYLLFWDNYLGKLFFLTLGTWSKSVLGFYPLLFTILDWLLKKLFLKTKKIEITWKSTVKLIIFLLLPSLWYIVGIAKFGWFFIENHFLSQVFKRLYVPIELHFGNKFFYFSYLWDNLNFINIFFIISLIFIFVDFIQTTKKQHEKILKTDSWLSFIVYFLPLPFLALLTIMKTKITWYVVIFLPFLSLLLSYLYLKVKSSYLRIGLLVAVLIYTFINIRFQALALNIKYTPPDKLVLAKCLKQKHVKALAFLVDDQERKNKNFLEAAHYDTTSSFLYGGSPSFVFYVQKNVSYYYNIDDFIKDYSLYRAVVLSKDDFKKEIKLSSIVKKEKMTCQTNNWLGIVK